jgi:enolase-phosphatase E1
MAGHAMILLDIEGTTTPIAFVTATLFPYARTHFPLYLERQGGTPEVRQAVARLHDEYERDRGNGESVPEWSPLAYLTWLMDRDRKSPALKDLQGRIWEEGYRNGTLVGQVYEDVPRALARWRDAGRAVGIYSSGSVLAQQWLFRRSTAGDLTPLLAWHFDTAVGAKQDPASYARIAADVNLTPDEILFVSDVAAELDAAREAGMRTAMSVRPGNPPQPEHGHPAVTSFDQLSGPRQVR